MPSKPELGRFRQLWGEYVSNGFAVTTCLFQQDGEMNLSVVGKVLLDKAQVGNVIERARYTEIVATLGKNKHTVQILPTPAPPTSLVNPPQDILEQINNFDAGWELLCRGIY